MSDILAFAVYNSMTKEVKIASEYEHANEIFTDWIHKSISEKKYKIDGDEYVAIFEMNKENINYEFEIMRDIITDGWAHKSGYEILTNYINSVRMWGTTVKRDSVCVGDNNSLLIKTEHIREYAMEYDGMLERVMWRYG